MLPSSSGLEPKPCLAELHQLVRGLLSMGELMVMPTEQTETVEIRPTAVSPVVEVMHLARPGRGMAALVTAVPVPVDDRPRLCR